MNLPAGKPRNIEPDVIINLIAASMRGFNAGGLKI
jgi:hypothetical protein